MEFSDIIAFLTHEDRLPTVLTASAPVSFLVYLLLRKVFAFAVRHDMSRDEMKGIALAAMNGAEREVNPLITVPEMAQRSGASLRTLTEHDATAHLLEARGEAARREPEVVALANEADALAWKASRIVQGHDPVGRCDAPSRGRRPGTKLPKKGE